MHVQRLCIGLLIIAVSISLSSCGNGIDDTTGPQVYSRYPDNNAKMNDSPVQSGGMLPPLPSPTEIARTLSAATRCQLDGAQFNPAWPNHNLIETSGIIGRYSPNWVSAQTSSPDDLAYGMYQFDLAGHDATQLPLTMVWSTPPTGGTLYIALANFAIGRWDWVAQGAHDPLLIADFDSYTSSDQLVACLVLVGTASSELTRISVGADDSANQQPVPIVLVDTSIIVPGGQANFDGSDSFDPDGTIERYDWDLNGDGTFEVIDGAAQVSHTYSAAGTYDAALRVSDNYGAQVVRHAAVLVRGPATQYDETESNDAETLADWVPLADVLPAPSFTGFRGSLGQGGYDGGRADYYLMRVPKTGYLTLEMLFTDDDADLDMRVFKLNSDGTTTTTLASATSTSDNETISLFFTEPGEYYWYCYVFSSAPADAVAEYTLTATFETSDPPVADLQANPTSGDWPLTVSFDASGSTDPDGTVEQYDYDWNGDGKYDATDAGPTVQHEYSELAGEITAVVRVTDDFGLTDTASVQITVNNDVPVASFTAAPASGARPLAVEFDAAASSDPDGSITKYEWDFNGDGAYDLTKGITADEPTLAAATYYVLGTYQATLRVTDNTGQTQTATRTITVTGNPNNEQEPNNDQDTANTSDDLAAANALPAFPIINYFGQVGPKADANPGGVFGDPDDWYAITLATRGEVSLHLDLYDASCDIDMKLYTPDNLSTAIGNSTSTTDVEQITLTLDPGTYYLRIYAYTAIPAWGGYRLNGTFTP